MEKEKQKRAMLAGIAAMALFMIGDWLLDVKGSGNKGWVICQFQLVSNVYVAF